MANKKYSILTYIFGDYEFVREPLEIDPNCEYILVTDNKSLNSENWKIIYLSDNFDNYTPISKTFYVRYHPFEFANTDTVLLLDGSMEVRKNLRKLFTDFFNGNYDCALGTFPNPINSISDLYSYWIKFRSYDIHQCKKNISFFNACACGIPKVYHETGYMIYRKNKISLEFLNTVWLSINRISNSEKDLDRLDQPIFNGILNSLYKELKILSLSRELVQSDYIRFYYHNTNNICKVQINKEFNKEFYKL